VNTPQRSDAKNNADFIAKHSSEECLLSKVCYVPFCFHSSRNLLQKEMALQKHQLKLATRRPQQEIQKKEMKKKEIMEEENGGGGNENGGGGNEVSHHF